MSIGEMCSQMPQEELLGENKNSLLAFLTSTLTNKYNDCELSDYKYLCLNEPEFCKPMVHPKECGEKIIGFMVNDNPKWLIVDGRISISEKKTIWSYLKEAGVDFGDKVEIINY